MAGIPPPPTQAPTRLLLELKRTESTNNRAQLLALRARSGLFAGQDVPEAAQVLALEALAPAELSGPGRAALPADHPEARLARSLRATFSSRNNEQAEVLRQLLLRTGIYERVVLEGNASIGFHTSADELTNNPTNDPHHKQWAFSALNLSPALAITKGRAAISSLDGGLVNVNNELTGNLRGHWSAHDQYNSVGVRQGFFPNELNQLGVPFIAHGTHTSGIMASSISSTSSTPTPGSGIAGVCPSCSFATMRLAAVNGIDSTFNGFTLMARQGASVVNFSAGLAVGIFDDPTGVYGAIDAGAARDVVFVASAGNDTSRGVDTPADRPLVYAIGATDITDRTWSEYRMFKSTSPYPRNQRHPQIGDLKVVADTPQGRCGISGALFQNAGECGSNLSAQVAFMAPGAQILGLVDRVYVDLGFLGTGICTAPQNCEHQAPARFAMGADPFLTASTAATGTYTVNRSLAAAGFPSYGNYGSFTGTSMSAPHISALFGLIRSINPLLSTKFAGDAPNGGEVGQALSTNARPVNSNATDDWPCIEAGINGCGAGIPNARSALEKTAGVIAGVQLNNRLTPVFQLRFDPNATTAGLTKGEALLASADAWLSTTSAQVAMAAIQGDLYFTGNITPAVTNFGTNQRLAYKAGYENGSSNAHVMPASQYRHRLFPTANSTQLPFASFYLYSTENAPAGYALAPLYRMSSKCYSIRKHFYTTNAATRDSYAAGPETTSTNVASCITGAAASARGYFYDGVEGYVLTTQAPGTVELRIGYRNVGGNDSGWAIFTSDEASRFTDYNTSVSVLGYVYPAVAWNSGVASYNDFDGDGLSDAYERGMKLNEQAADSDCDGSPDGVEFPIAGISNSDPMLSSTCVDLRVRDVSNANALRLELSNVGPAAGNIKVTLSSGSTFTANLVAPANCTAVTPQPHIGRLNQWSCAIAVGSSALFVVNQITPSNGNDVLFKGEADLASGQIDSVPSNNSVTLSCGVACN